MNIKSLIIDVFHQTGDRSFRKGGLALLSLAALLFPVTAYAAQAGDVNSITSGGQMYSGGCENPSARGCDERTHVYNAGQAASYSLGKYTRAGAKIGNLRWDYTIPSVMPEGGGDQGTYSVTGEYTCAGGATWSFQTTGGSLCWGSHTLYSEPNCAGTRNVENYGAQAPGNIAAASNMCSSGVCLIDYQAPSDKHFITPDTNDNMLALLPAGSGTQGFIVNNLCGSQPYWMQRTSVEADKYLMIPTKCTDYQSFIDGQPSGSQIENACHPVNVSVCPSPPSRPAMPAHPGCGEHAHGTSWCSGGYKTEQACYTIPGTGTPPGPSTVSCSDVQVCQGYSYCNCGSVDDQPGDPHPPTVVIPPTVVTTPSTTSLPVTTGCPATTVTSPTSLSQYQTRPIGSGTQGETVTIDFGISGMGGSSNVGGGGAQVGGNGGGGSLTAVYQCSSGIWILQSSSTTSTGSTPVTTTPTASTQTCWPKYLNGTTYWVYGWGTGSDNSSPGNSPYNQLTGLTGWNSCSPSAQELSDWNNR